MIIFYYTFNRMKNELVTTLIFLLIFGGLIICTWMLHKYLKWSSENSRKFLHVSGGTLCLFIPSYIHSHWSVLFLCTVSFLLLLYTFLTKQLAAVHKTNRFSYGSILFPFPIYYCFLATTVSGNDIYFYLPVSLLTFADTCAEITGKKWGMFSVSFFNGQKTLAGSIGFFITALIVTVYFSICTLHFSYSLQTLFFLLTLSTLSAITELLSLKGFDNITMPITVLIILYIFLN